MWFDSLSDLLSVLAVGTAAYVAVVIVLRLSGKRTLAQLNAFDLVVTVALGSTLSAAVLDSTVAWAEGVVAFVLLAGGQFLIAFITSRWPSARTVATASPAVLVRDGVVLTENLRRQRMTESEMRQAVRASGAGGLSGIAAIVLETDGKLSVVATSAVDDGWALADLPG